MSTLNPFAAVCDHLGGLADRLERGEIPPGQAAARLRDLNPLVRAQAKAIDRHRRGGHFPRPPWRSETPKESIGAIEGAAR